MIEKFFRGTYSIIEVVSMIFAIMYLWESHIEVSITFIVLLSISALYAAYKIGKGELNDD